MKKQINITNPITYGTLFTLALGAASILLLPFLAMQFTNEVNWDLFDFVIAWILLFGTGITYRLVAGRMGNIVGKVAVGIAVGTALLLVWANLAVGFIGSGNNPANQMYFGVLAAGIVAAIIGRFQPSGMARALVAMAITQGLVTAIVLLAGMQQDDSVIQVLAINSFFVFMWLGSALLFSKANKG